MQNYHKHTYFSNILVADSTTSYDAYAKRAVELGHKVLSSVEHGWQSNYYEVYDVAKKYGLKFVFGAEGYWVKDRKKEYPNGVDKKGNTNFKKDRSNCHIILLAKNEEGRRDINEALADANIDGYYGQPRLDLELLLRIKPENVIVTTACIKFWVYDDIEEIIKTLHNHFKENLYLEVQYNNTKTQKDLNKRILKISKEQGIDIILGYDSHYIHEEDAEERFDYLEGRDINYRSDEDESSEQWYMDYPTDDEAIRRLKEQGVLSDEEIERAMNNTDKILEFEDIILNDDIKLPTLYPDKSQEWKDNKLKEIINNAWKEARKHIPKERHKEYIEGIKYEVDAITSTKMTDYFLLDYEIVKKGIENGGIITKTGRGSCVSYYVNSLLGFSNIDRFISPVKLYPDRFMSKTRILLTRSLPD